MVNRLKYIIFIILEIPHPLSICLYVWFSDVVEITPSHSEHMAFHLPCREASSGMASELPRHILLNPYEEEEELHCRSRVYIPLMFYFLDVCLCVCLCISLKWGGSDSEKF